MKIINLEQFPVDVEEVQLIMADQFLAPRGDELRQCAESFFNNLVARGWRDNKGIPLFDWKPVAREYACTWSKERK